jgi:hypothetical protein
MDQQKPVCYDCGQVIAPNQKFVDIASTPFHADCWRCFKCDKKIDEVYFPIVGEAGAEYDK